MNYTKLLSIMAGAIGGVLAASGQGFVNLNFESATNIAPGSGQTFVVWNYAAPGWNHGSGENTTFVFHGTPNSNDTSSYFLVDQYSASSSLTPLDGNYSFALYNGYLTGGNPSSGFLNAYIDQSGLVPPGTKSFTLLAAGAPFSIAINGVNLPIISLGGNMFGGDVSSYAGETVDLKVQNDTPLLGTPLVIDDLGFYPNPVPEPGSLALLASGLLVVGAAWRRTRRRG